MNKNKNNQKEKNNELLKIIVNEDSEECLAVECKSKINDPEEMLYTIAVACNSICNNIADAIASQMMPFETITDDESYDTCVMLTKNELYIALTRYLMDMFFDEEEED